MGEAKHLIGSLLLALLLGSGPVSAAGDPDVVLQKAPGDVGVMTLNQYIGADLMPLLTAPPETFNATLLQALRQAVATDFRARVERQAEEIARRRPDLIGLQEVFDIRCQDLPPKRGACADPSIAGAFVDQLALTLQALRAAGAEYRVAATVENYGFRDITVVVPGVGAVRGLPFTIGGKTGLLASHDRDVILKRAGIPTKPVSFASCTRPSAQGCNYSASVRLVLAGKPFEIKRGYVAVDAKVRGRDYRFVNTHLEIKEPLPGNPLSIAIQVGQAAELVGALAAVPALPRRPLILVGDLNSSPDDRPPPSAPILIPPYKQIVAAGFTDIWAARHRRSPGFTCCQDADLRNRRSKLSERFDYILAKAQPLLLQQARVVLDEPWNRTRSRPGQPRLWPSDHASVVAQLKFRGASGVAHQAPAMASLP